MYVCNVCMYVCVYVCMYVYIYTYIYVYICIYIYVYIYTYICTYKSYKCIYTHEFKRNISYCEFHVIVGNTFNWVERFRSHRSFQVEVGTQLAPKF